MRKKDILLIGGGGHCKSCIDVIEEEGIYSIKGIIDLPEKVGANILDYPIIDIDDNIEKLLIEIKYAFITTGHIKSPKLRIRLFNQVKKAGGLLPVIISPKAQVSKHAKIQEGTIVMHGAVINAGTKIGKNCIINNLALIEHDVIIGDHVHVSTGSRINGNCKVGNNNFVGSGTVINQEVKIADDVIIGSGALVTKNIEESGVYVGNPTKRIK